MKIKELQKTVNVAWSPAGQSPIYLAAGSAAQQLLDTSFASSNPSLELYALNLADQCYDLELVGVQQSAQKFHKLIWSPFDGSGNYSNGVIVGGCESGYLKMFSAEKLLKGENALIAESNKHNGSVRTIDFNPFKSNLIASGASESEIFIWDVNNISVPMTPGQKTQPLEDVCGVAWNRQVQHILASSFANRCVIWDLRKNEPIIKLSDTQSRIRWRVTQWHPDVATQLWLASEDDQCPVIQLWDLRYATAPSKTLQIHSRGVLGMTWCQKDTELLMSCAKDNKILCWNGNSEEVLSEISSANNQWYSDISWCPQNPALIAASSFDGNVTIYSIFGGIQQQIQTTSKIADSFPGMENASQHDNVPQHPTTQSVVYQDLKKPPKWMKQPSGISFGFGGKFVTFNASSRNLEIKQLVTDDNLVKRSSELEEVLEKGSYSDYCKTKADQSADQQNRYLWYFLKAYFEENTNNEFLNLLGYDVEDVALKFSKFIEVKDPSENHVEKMTNQFAGLNRGYSTETSSSEDSSNPDGYALNGSATESSAKIPYKLETSGTEGLICEALLTGNIHASVELCMNAGRTTDAIILASLGGSDLLAKTQYRYLKDSESFVSNLISAMVMADWSGVLSQCTIDSWKEGLVAALTHSPINASMLCERLGERLQYESNGDDSVLKNSILCYICAGNIERIIDAWTAINGADALEDSEKLQDLVEIVVLLGRAMELKGNKVAVFGKYAELLSKYATLLASQGSLDTALTYVGTSQDDESIIDLRERLYFALGHKKQQLQNNLFQKNTFHNHQQQQPRLSQTRTISTSSNPGMPPMSSSLFQPVQVASQPPPMFNTGLPNASNHFDNPWQPPQPMTQAPLAAKQAQPPTFMNPAENILPPPRPSSVSSVGSGVQASAMPKPKRPLDPSVQSGPSYGQFQPQAFSPQQPSGFTTNPIQSNPYNTNPMMQSMPFTPAMPATSPMNPMQPQPTQQMWPNQNQNYDYQNNNGNNMMNGSSLPPPPTGNQLSKNPTPPPGWNDPPEFKVRAQPKKKAPAAVNTPITDPFFGAPNPNQQIENDSMYQQQQHNNYGQQQQPQQQFGSPPPMMMNNNNPQPTNFYQPQQQPIAQQSQTINYSNFQTSFVGQSPEQSVSPPPQVEPPKQKLPLPEEFIYMQTVFEELKSQCMSAATNPQMKRKLDDVSRRFETLYDLLREKRLSESTIESLNQIVQYVQIGDYMNGLGLHTQMVSGPEFSKIAPFMPGIKILLQLALQLQVYLR